MKTKVKCVSVLRRTEEEYDTIEFCTADNKDQWVHFHIKVMHGSKYEPGQFYIHSVDKCDD